MITDLFRSFRRPVLLALLLATPATAQVPNLINYQGRVAVGVVNFEGSGLFKFALVNTNGSTTYWSNDGTSTAGSQPTAAVTLTVTKGLYSVLLGNATLPNMTIVPGTVFTNSDVRLRVWFNDGTNGFQLLTPDQRIAAVGYAMMAGSVSAGAITSSMIAANAVQSGNIAAGAVGPAQLAANAVQAGNIAAGAVGTAQLSNGSVTSSKIGPWAIGPAKLAPNSVTGESWAATPSAALAGRIYHTSVWTGTEFIVWGGTNAATGFGDGARFNPTTGIWTPISQVGAPSARDAHVAVWTGTEMIIWGGNSGPYGDSASLNTGARYNPTTDTWIPLSTINAPSARQDCMAVWAGSQMIVWGGYPNTTTGGRYNPATDTWTATSTVNAPQGTYSSAIVWSGTEMIVWSGGNGSNYVNTGGRYNPVSDTWVATSTTNAPQGRRTWQNSNAVWTGTEMIVWGGDTGSKVFVNTGGRYNPATNTWTATSTSNAPSARDFHTMVWTGSRMNVWGGALAGSFISLNDGAFYDPAADAWSTMTSTGAPVARERHTAAWAGSVMILWGGFNGSTTYYSDGALYNPGAISAGSIGSIQLAAGAVKTQNIASGAIGSTQLASGITLGGTTTGTFSGNLSGNATTATSAFSATTAVAANTADFFTGTMAGDVTGTQGATVVATVGTSSAANVHAAELAANAATAANTASTLVKRDASGNFTASTITANGGITLPPTSSASVGVMTQNGSSLLHSYGTNNLFVGAGAGNFTMTGNSNAAIGANALFSNTTGTYNTASGDYALSSNTSGSYNSASGMNALLGNTKGSYNTASGSYALTNNTTGGINVALGVGALNDQSFSNGGNEWYSNNVAVGFGALQSNAPVSTTTGINNTAVGTYALTANSTGANNIAIGNSAGSLLTTGSNNIAIGHQGVAGESNAIRIGDGSSQTAAFITGISGTTSSGGVAVFVSSSGQLGTVTSSRRFKQDIHDMSSSSESILALRPVTFRYKPELDGRSVPQWGLIAEEVEQVNSDLVVRDDHGLIQTVRYEQVNAMLLNEFLKDHRRADARDKEITRLHHENAAIKKRLAQLEAKDQEREAREKAREARLAKLEQFIPAAPKPKTATTANLKTN